MTRKTLDEVSLVVSLVFLVLKISVDAVVCDFVCVCVFCFSFLFCLLLFFNCALRAHVRSKPFRNILLFHIDTNSDILTKRDLVVGCQLSGTILLTTAIVLMVKEGMVTSPQLSRTARASRISTSE